MPKHSRNSYGTIKARMDQRPINLTDRYPEAEMSVVIDDTTLETEQMGFETVGHVLAHAQRDNRLVTSLLIDGQEPDLGRIGIVRESPLLGHTVYIETAEPRQIALEVLSELKVQLEEADRLRGAAVDLLYQNQPNRALEKLSGCFSTWHIAQESVLKTARLLRIDLEIIEVAGKPMLEFLRDFADQLRQVKSSLEHRDFVTLTDVLNYEFPQSGMLWQEALGAVRDVLRAH